MASFTSRAIGEPPPDLEALRRLSSQQRVGRSAVSRTDTAIKEPQDPHVKAPAGESYSDTEAGLKDQHGSEWGPITANQNAKWWYTAYHNITAMIGAGVLGLPMTFKYLGWGGGTVVFVLAFWCSWYTFKVLVQMHEVDDETAKAGKRRLNRYHELTEHLLGRRAGRWSILPFQLIVLVGIPILYVITAGNNMSSVYVSATGHEAPNRKLWWMVAFAGLQLILSQLPSFNDLASVSLLGMLMSFGYCGIATVLSIIQAATTNRGAVDYSRPPLDTTTFAFGVMNSLVTMLFAYGGHNIALEIQATLPCPPSTINAMMVGVNATFAVTFLCYAGVTFCGYAAFGNAVRDNILDSLSVGPLWLKDLAHMMVVVHVIAGYQVYAYPVFDMMETSISRRTHRPVSWPMRLLVRGLFVAGTWIVALLIPFFGDVLGLLGAVGITPTTFVMPCLLWLLWRKPARFTIRWIANWTIVITCTLIGILGVIGACYGIAQSYRNYSFTANFT